MGKRQQKAETFKRRGKGKDLVEDVAEVPEVEVAEKDKKHVVERSEKRSSKKRKAAEDTEGSDRKKQKQEHTPRYIVFVGNLPFDATKESIMEHFEQVGGIVDCRLMTDKKTKKPKGFAFMEFKDAETLKKALKFHHTFFKKRQINVELTAGGGGNAEGRQAKLKAKNEKLTQERANMHKKVQEKKQESESSYSKDTEAAEQPAKEAAPAPAKRTKNKDKYSKDGQAKNDFPKRAKKYATGVNAIAGSNMRTFMGQQEQ
ncbi:hypothetical protein BZG36_03266 [Bifiguratus adelaidae]|uniref:RRM domain-containing protein n=1 Tax=Bifiguratus adelaidae TaxID=1938954 RepID=A0A261XXD9_9FUNG|nr:hypothetical protein BZG36_03266 [Bifiguratus adelaidae]